MEWLLIWQEEDASAYYPMGGNEDGEGGHE